MLKHPSCLSDNTGEKFVSAAAYIGQQTLSRLEDHNMEISSAIVGAAMEMHAQEFAAQYSVGVMKEQMDFVEDISMQLVQQMMQLSVGPAQSGSVDILA